MAITRRSRTFSPYSYSIQYAKTGEGPYQKPRPYVNAAILEEEELVVKAPTIAWLVYVINNFYFSSDEDCVLQPERVVSDFMVVKKDSNFSESLDSDLRLLKLADQSFEANLKNGDWHGSNEVTISNHFHQNVDCFVLGDNEYLKIKKKFTSESIIIRFSQSFSKDDYDSLKVVVFSIDNMLTSFASRKIETSSIQYSQPANSIYFDNVFNTNRVVPLLFDMDGFSLNFDSPDLLPSRVIIPSDSDMTYSRSIIEAKIDELNSDIEAIASEFTGTPSEVLYQTNAEYKALVDEKALYEQRLTDIGDANTCINVLNATLYTYKFNDFHETIRYGVNTSNVTWNGDVVTIKHNLGGKVNVVIDAAKPALPKCRIFCVNSNTIRMTFTDPKYVVFNVSMFKVG